MLRCGQPLTTMGGKRSREDEKLVNATLGNDLKGIIIDTRSQTAAMNSRTKGKQNNLSHVPPVIHANLSHIPPLTHSNPSYISLSHEPTCHSSPVTHSNLQHIPPVTHSNL